MKIAVIFTGGTIGSRVKEGWISPDGGAKYTLIEAFGKRLSHNLEFSFFEPFTILSENLSAKEINDLVFLVKETAKKDFDGIIITHGTDTLIFTACALSYALGSDCLPTVLVSSNFPLDDIRANGHDNFALAAEHIAKGDSKGVSVSYKNRDGDAKILNPHALLSYLEADDRLFTLEEKNGKAHSPLNFTLCENHNLLVIDSHPGDSFTYSLKGVNAVILRPYHSGTLNTENLKLKDFCKRAKSKKIPVFLINYPKGITYESSAVLNELGIIPLADSTFTDVFVKLWIGISLKKELESFVLE